MLTSPMMQQGAAGRPMVEAMDVHKYFGKLHVLRGISLSVPKGRVQVIIGPSGSEQSALLRCLDQLAKSHQGKISSDGEPMGCRVVNGKLRQESPRNIARTRPEVGMVFQHFNLLPHTTALQNTNEAPVEVRGMSRPVA